MKDRTKEFRLVNGTGASVTLSTEGARVVGVCVPDSEGRLADVVVGSNSTDTERWDAECVGDNSVRFSHTLDGAPASVTYVWTDDNVLEIYVEGAGEPPTLPRLRLGDGRCNTLWVNAHRYFSADGVAEVKGTPLDYTTARRPGSRLDATWVVDDWIAETMNEVAVVANHRTGREVDVYSTLPLVGISTSGGIAVRCRAEEHAKRGHTELVFIEFRVI